MFTAEDVPVHYIFSSNTKIQWAQHTKLYPLRLVYDI
jgi:hypothetical protein